MSNQVNRPRSLTGPKRSDISHFTIDWRQANNYTDEKYGWRHLWVYVSTVETNHDEKHPLVSKSIEVPVDYTTYEYTMDRRKYHPIKPSHYLNTLTMYAEVEGANGGKATSLPVKIVFEKPKPPSCDFVFDDTTGLLTMTCKAPKDDKKDCYWCEYKVLRKDTKTGSSRYDNGKENLALNTDGKELQGKNNNAEFDLKTNVEQLMMIPDGGSIVFEITLTSRGFAGDTSKKFVYSVRPASLPVITKIEASNSNELSLAKNAVTTKMAAGMMRVFYSTKLPKTATANYDDRAVTDYTLQRNVTPYDVNRSIEAALDDGWQDVDTNMGSTSDLSLEQAKKAKQPSDGIMGEPMVNLLTAIGFNNNAHVYDKRVWYRVKSVRQGFVRYSIPKEAKNMACPPPSPNNDKAGFMALRNSTLEPGTSIIGVVGWDKAGEEERQAIDNPNLADAKWTTVVEWSEHRNAVSSNQKPNSLEIDWMNSAALHETLMGNYEQRVATGEYGDPIGRSNDDEEEFDPTSTTNKVVPWEKSASFAIYGLTPGVKYYLWTRRHMVIGDYDEYGPRSEAPTGYFPFTPIDDPTSVHVYTEENYVIGSDLNVSWAHNSNSDQKYWAIYAIPYKQVYKEGVTLVSRMTMKMIACGAGTDTSHKIPAPNMADVCPLCVSGDGKTFDTSKKLGIVVGVSTGGKEMLSCSNDRNRYIGANFLDVVAVPIGTMALNTKATIDDSVTVDGGHESARPKVSFRIVTDSDKSHVLKVFDVRGSRSMNVSYANMTCEVIVTRTSDSRVLGKWSGLNVDGGVQSVADINGTISIPKGMDSLTVTLRILSGTYIDLLDTVHTIEPSSASKSVKLKDEEDKVLSINASDYTAYLFSRTKSVVGIVNVFAKHDTWYQLPDGEHLQPAGECVLSTVIPTSSFKNVDVVFPTEDDKKMFSSYTKGNGRYEYVAKVNIYSHRNMFSGSTYIVQGYLRDGENEDMVSEPKEIEFVHLPSRKAQPCGPDTIIQGVMTDLSQKLAEASAVTTFGTSGKNIPPSPSVEIRVGKPSNHDTTDRFDLYRITPDGGVLILSNCRFKESVTDLYAPFSNDSILRYAIVTVTNEGDMAWREVSYSLKCNTGMRFDWGASDNMRALELPFNVKMKDSYTKDTRTDTALDGSVSVLFNKAVVRQASNSAKIVKYDNRELYSDPYKFEMIRELARYAGPVFYRGDNGTAYECSVEVDGIDESYNELLSDVSFKLTEINPPSGAYSPNRRDRTINEALAPLVKQPSSWTVSEAEVMEVQKNITSQLLKATLYRETIVLDKTTKTKKNVIVRLSQKVKNKVYYDFNWLVVKSLEGIDCTVSVPYIEVDLRKAPAEWMEKRRAESKAFRVYVRTTYKVGNSVLSDAYYDYGKLDTLVKVLNNAENQCVVPRGKSDKNVTIQSIVYLVKKIKMEKKVVTSKKRFTLTYEIATDPVNDKSNRFTMTFKNVSGTIPTNNSSTYRIYLSSAKYGTSGFDQGAVYYDSGNLVLSNKAKKGLAVSKNVPAKKSKVNVEMSSSADIWASIVVKVGNTVYSASAKVPMRDLDTASDIHSDLTKPLSASVTVEKK